MATQNKETTKSVEYGHNGLPVISDEVEAQNNPAKPLILLGTIPRVVCLAIAVAICKFGANADYGKSLLQIPGNFGYSYLGAFVFSVMVWWLNTFPAAAYKPLVMPQNAGNLRFNMSIFKVNVQNGAPSQPYVVLEDEGNIGKYNRSNRSLTNFVENCAGFIVNYVMASVVFPFPCFILVVIFAFGRVFHQTGSVNRYGTHAPGFMLTMIGQGTVEMLVLIIGLQKVVGLPGLFAT
jgi:uncharacterized membrane protein YecN with MAPEG domain